MRRDVAEHEQRRHRRPQRRQPPSNVRSSCPELGHAQLTGRSATLSVCECKDFGYSSSRAHGDDPRGHGNCKLSVRKTARKSVYTTRTKTQMSGTTVGKSSVTETTNSLDRDCRKTVGRARRSTATKSVTYSTVRRLNNVTRTT